MGAVAQGSGDQSSFFCSAPQELVGSSQVKSLAVTPLRCRASQETLSLFWATQPHEYTILSPSWVNRNSIASYNKVRVDR